jgi:hypothetical protein
MRMVIGYGCMECGMVSNRNEWMEHTAMEVVGTILGQPAVEHISEIAEPAVRNDPNNFWICPECNTQVHGHQITTEYGSVKHGKVEEVEEAEIQVNLTIVLSVERKYTREEILGRIHDILLEGVDPATSVEAIFDQILIEGIDY